MSLTQNYFKLSEFLIDPAMRDPKANVPLHVCQKILTYHLPVLNPIRHRLGRPVIVSQHSGYRTVQWEKDHGRDGDSEHTFFAHGAVDLMCSTFEELVRELMGSNYARVIVYWHKSFAHCDFKDAQLGRRYYEMSEDGVLKEMEGVRR